MSLTVAQFKTKVAPKLHGTTLNKVSGFYDKMLEAAGNLTSYTRPYTMIREYVIENAIYDHVYNYACADDLEADSIIDIRPVGERRKRDSLQGEFSQQFDIKKKENTYEVEYINGVKTLRLSKCLKPRTILAALDSLTIGATVTGSGDVLNLGIDYLDHISGDAAVSFDLSGATGQGIITVQLPQGIDISTLVNQGAIFEWLKFPTAADISNVKVRVGSDPSNFYQGISTAAQQGVFVDDAWQLLIQLLKNSTKTGTPDFTKVAWIQVELNYTMGTTQTGVHLDNITAALGEAWEVVYYSNCMFTDSTGTIWKDTPTSDNDLIQLEGTRSVTAFLYAFMLTLQQELKGENMAADYAFFQTALYGRFGLRGVLLTPGLYAQLAGDYPDQSIVRQTDYYEFAELNGN